MRTHVTIQWIAALSLGLGVATGAAAQEARKDAADGLPYNEIKTSPEGVRYLMGGIGVEEQQRLNARAEDFNTKLVFTLERGAYVADVQVQVKDVKGRTVIEDTADGPYFFAALAPGRYTISATFADKTVTRKLQVGGEGLRTAYLRWPNNAETDPYPGGRSSAVGAGAKRQP